MQDISKIYTDGGARGNPGPAAAAFVVLKDGGVLIKHSEFLGIATNNEAEYKALAMALSWLVDNQKLFQNSKISFFLDSELVVRQVTGLYKVKSEKLKLLIIKIKALEKRITDVEIKYNIVRREKNKLADKLVNLKLDENPM
ncbi:hypothetical protein A2714_03760 [Candidatus Woesebacteria bacterium RIFCSPHIGHO2_01_FULL_38_9]|uniref:RNase H type-1 domain-containing protein n=2 Tax=Candidatus Woeseibacteriota TaxID=1752722 RepID=A0A1F7Y0B8_9BACT|nr:MAG: hypothetical protein A2714_03760 [Candidatus Woesebacteria bacterium RIFCSPHIGHO2_01_FULL_38_9]OGM59147.1 MAG: hypothetical protein A3A75_02925 [Candidatus Woesebacteria bacterium RIFCSPLOWO2_01_FULL_39_10]